MSFTFKLSKKERIVGLMTALIAFTGLIFSSWYAYIFLASSQVGLGILFIAVGFIALIITIIALIFCIAGLIFN